MIRFLATVEKRGALVAAVGSIAPILPPTATHHASAALTPFVIGSTTVPTVGQTVVGLLPEGTRPYLQREDWSQCPEWPPDIFAVAATIVERAGLYALDRYSGRAATKGLFGESYRAALRGAAAAWRRDPSEIPQQVLADWSTVVGAWHRPLGDLRKLQRVPDAAIRLATTTDEVCEGIGFRPADNTPFARFVFDAAVKRYQRNRRSPLPFLPNSLCKLVGVEEASVQPKALTSQVGCNVRCLTHHLALLPGTAEVETWWHFAHPAAAESGPVNLLLVPFPFAISGEVFRAGQRIIDESESAHFSVRQGWLNGKGEATPHKLGQFLAGLIEVAEREVRHVHGIVLPELAISSTHARQLAVRLAKDFKVDLFVAGVAKTQGKRARNQVYSSVFVGGRQLYEWEQSKHHRWMLDDAQIRRYNLGHVLNPSSRWWEEIDVAGRSVNFTVFRTDVSICTLVCEDLARLDPVHPVLRSVGPNLVICLLMDGPQLERRWPGRYATGLAEDPGSAVLTLTCLGMVKRSHLPGETERREIALWKEAGGRAQELHLPPGAHGLLLTLNTSDEANWTLDGRSDGHTSVKLSLGAVQAVRHPDPPRWADSA